MKRVKQKGKSEEQVLEMLLDAQKVILHAETQAKQARPIHLEELFKNSESMLAKGAVVARKSIQLEELPDDGPVKLSVYYGEPHQAGPDEPVTLVEMLRRAAAQASEKGIVYVLPNGEESFQSYPELLQEAERVAGALRGLGIKTHDSILFQFEKNRNFVTAFWGCVLAGYLPTPLGVAPTFTEMNAAVGKLHNAWNLLNKPVILTDQTLVESMQSGLQSLWQTDELRIVALESLLNGDPAQNTYTCTQEDLVLNMLTSGSTGMPKCLQHRHRTIVTRSQVVVKQNHFHQDDVLLNWMPMDHVGGIVMFHIQAVYQTCLQVLPKIESFLADPLNWLHWIEKYRATSTWAPNFAFAMVNEEVKRIKQGSWDLSTMRHIQNGGEAVVEHTCRRFLELLAPHGLPKTAIYPMFGMSEISGGTFYSDRFTLDDPNSGVLVLNKTSLGGSIRQVDRDHPNAAVYVDCGLPAPGVNFRIVDENNQPLPQGRIGRLQFSGQTLMVGYFNNPKANAESFTEDGWFNSGDLAYMYDNRLTLTGREKDVIILNGNNYYNYEIEFFVQEVEGVEVTYVAACAVEDPDTGTDSLALFFSPTFDDFESDAGFAHCKRIMQNIREEVIRKIGISPKYMLPVRKHVFPKTNSGKIQRAELGRWFDRGVFDAFIKRLDCDLANERTLPSLVWRTVWKEQPLGAAATETVQVGDRVIFADELGLAKRLAGTDSAPSRTILVQRGAQFSKVSGDEYRIDPHSAADYRRLMQELREAGVTPRHIVHLWGYTASEAAVSSLGELQEAQYAGSFSVLFLMQAIAEVFAEQEMQLTVGTNDAQVTERADARVAFEKSTMIGLLKAIPHEFPRVASHFVDFSGVDIEAHLRDLQREIASPHEGTAVAHRAGARLVPRLEQVNLLEACKKEVPIAPGGLYLITGGLGGIGMTLATQLLRAYQARLILLGRTPLAERDAESQEQLRELQALAGADGYVRYQAVDLDRLDVLQAVVTEAEEETGVSLSGIVHLAGTLYEETLVELTHERLEEAYAAKVYGTYVLHQLLQGRPQALFVGTSSARTLTSGMTLGSYCAGNQFAETFAWHQRSMSDVRSYCFAWSLWDNLGMAKDTMVKGALQKRGYQVISPKRGYQYLLAGLMTDTPVLQVGLDVTKSEFASLVDGEQPQETIWHVFFSAGEAVSVDKLYHAEVQMRKELAVDGPDRWEFHQVAEIPLLPSGEIDEERLANLIAEHAMAAASVPPRNQLEIELVELWEKLLKVQEIGITHNFFALGGHSLKATQFLSAVQERYGVEVPLRLLFESPTIAAFAEVIAARMTERSDDSHLMTRRAGGQVLPMSYAQKRLWFLYQLEPDNPFYNNTVSMRLRGALHVQALERALQTILDRHDTLRTRFAVLDDEPVQIIEPEKTLAVRHADRSDVPETERDALVLRLANEEAKTPFDVSRDDLLRASLTRFSAEDHLLLVSIHHIVSDGWSIGVFAKELSAHYAKLVQGLEPDLPELPIQYGDFTLWQNEWIKGDVFQKDLIYWKEQFAGSIPTLELPTDFVRPPVQTYDGKTLELQVSTQMTEELKRLSRRTGATLFMTMLSGFLALLHRYTGQEDLVVGTVIANRNRAQIEELIGFFANTLALRTDLSGDPSFEQLLERVKLTTLSAYEHQDVPFEMLVDELKVERDLSRTPLFQVLFVLQNAEMEQAALNAEVSVEQKLVDTETAKFDLSMFVHERENGLRVVLEYNVDLFLEETMSRLLQRYVQFLEHAVLSPMQSIGRLNLLTAEEKHRLLVEFNNTYAEATTGLTVPELFEQRAQLVPDRVALVYGATELTYREVNERANRLARTLRAQGVGPERIVGLLVERSPEMVIGALAILKAGGAYLPIEPSTPVERIKYMLQDSGAGVLCTQQRFLQLVAFEGCVLDLEAEATYDAETGSLERLHEEHHLAYVIYTSGSTGNPKGVMIEHRNVMNTLSALEARYPLGAEDAYLLKTTFTFDVSVTELFGWFFGAGKLVILAPGMEKDPQEMVKLIVEQRVTHINFVPSMLKMFFLNEGLIQSLRGLKYIFMAGEAVTPDLVRKLQANLPDVVLENIYGPTEITIYATHYSLAGWSGGAVPIGNPLRNVRAYVVDRHHQIQPLGVAGELCIAGAGVARGYLNNQSLTAEKFIQSPVVPGEIWYKTGDLARFRPDGTIEYLGRIDFQVKVRGYRIETGEVQEELQKHEAIADCVVVVRTDANDLDYLAAYYMAEETLSVTDLRHHLSRSLPDYMIPSRFVKVEAWPLMASGKIDVKALPEPLGGGTDAREFVAPQTEMERQLAEIWSHLLRLEHVGVHDHFFEIGGHSLLATLLLAQVQKQFEVDLSLRNIFQSPTIHGLAALIEQAERRSFTSIPNVEPAALYPATPMQTRMYVVSHLDGDGTSYNLPIFQVAEGPLDLERLAESFQAVVNRHEVLRTSFVMTDGTLYQRVQEDVRTEMRYVEASEAEMPSLTRAFIQPFDLGQAPLIRLQVVRLEDHRHVLMFDVHHIISDGVSSQLLLRDLSQLYSGHSLPKQRIQYKDFAAWHRNLLTSAAVQNQEAYWLNTLADEIPVLNLPTDFPRPSVQRFEGRRVIVEVAPALAQSVRKLAHEQGATLYITLLSAYYVLLAKYTGQEDIIVGSLVSGRPHADLQQVMGMFVNTLAMRSTPAADKTFTAFVAEVKEMVLKSFEHQDYPFEELVEKLNVRRDLSRNPLFDTLFTLQNLDSHQDAAGSLVLKPYGFDYHISKFDLSLFVFEAQDKLTFEFEYSTHLFREETIAKMAAHFLEILKQLTDDQEVRLAEVDMLTAEEKQVLLAEWNRTERAYPTHKLIAELFEERVAEIPDHVALVFGENALTYRQVNERANQLAHALRAHGVGAGSIVSLVVERSFEMVISVLAVLKAGGAYVPIDPEYPAERIAYILQDSGTCLVLTHARFLAKVQFAGAVLDVEGADLQQGETGNLAPVVTARDLAYILYTSGSTGKPKGVMIEQRSVTNILFAAEELYPLRETDAYLLKTTYTFDVSVMELFGWFVGRGKLVILAPGAEKDPEQILQVIEQTGVTHINFVPTMLQLFVQNAKQIAVMNRLHYIFVAGEALPYELVETLRAELIDVRIENIYGPTEVTIYATHYPVCAHPQQIVPIGKPLPNVRCYILNSYDQLQPIGVPGELCVAGAGLARGYLNNAELTAEKFKASRAVPQELLYRTGDLARLLPDGQIEYMGRIDQQVKIRGYRIETGEVLERLLEHPDVIQAVVLARQDERQHAYLCAYYLSEREIAISDIRSHLASTLPDYMIPTHFLQVQEFPQTASGKIDRNALPEPNVAAADPERTYVAPRHALEEKMVRIWESILQVEQVGVYDDFFLLGGDSIRAIQIASKFNDDAHFITVQDVLTLQNISNLCLHVKERHQVREYEQGLVHGEKARTPIEHWFFGLQFAEAHYYNQSVHLQVHRAVRRDLLEQALTELVHYHDGLRLNVDAATGTLFFNPRHAEEPFALVFVDLTEWPQEEQAAEIDKRALELKSSFDLAEGLLFKALLVQVEVDAYKLIISAHHLVTDGISWRILLDDLTRLYSGLEQGTQVVLPKKTASLLDWTQYLQDYAQRPALQEEKAYWEEARHVQSEIPLDLVCTDWSQLQQHVLYGELTSEWTDQLGKVHQAYNTTIQDFLMTALARALKEWKGLEQTVVELESHGRHTEEVDLSRTVGWFTSIYPFRLQLPADSIEGQIKSVKEQIRAIPNHGFGYGILKYLCHAWDDAPKRSEIRFNYLGHMDLSSGDELFAHERMTSEQESSHLNEASVKIEMNSMIVNGAYRMELSYNRGAFREETMLQLRDLYLSHLTQLIEHAKSKKETEFTPSDFTEADLNQDELDSLFS